MVAMRRTVLPSPARRRLEITPPRIVRGAGLHLPGPRGTGAEIGYSVHAGARGHGLATRAARLLAAWGFAHGLARIELRVAVGNTASQLTALRAGFGYEGPRRRDHL